MRNAAIRVGSGVAIFLCISACAVANQPQVPIVVAGGGSALEHLAAEELAAHLRRLYPTQQFPVVTSLPREVIEILLGTVRSQPKLARLLRQLPVKPESYIITTAKQGSINMGIIAGADPRGTLFGVYALLEKLGYGFYLSYNTEPAPRREPFRFEGWHLADEPLFPDRIVLPWFNFLSGASAWNLADWQRWTVQIARMRYNTAMVHCYGNDPIFTFRFHGIPKPVGYIPTTVKGRDWGTEHVNDVRRLVGGRLFGDPVFGANAALVPDEQRVQAATALMKRVFTFARGRGLHVAFVLDTDTVSANPQEMIRTLPPSARIRSGEFQLANPDTPEGYQYYRAQIATLLGLYPQIDRLVAFFRPLDESLWSNVKERDFPPFWKAQFQAALEKNLRLRGDEDAARIFAISRVVAAFDRALRELGRPDIDLGASSFWYSWVSAADAFLLPKITLVVMDQWEILDTRAVEALLEHVGTHRKVFPIEWAQHDDWAYLARPATPFQGLSSFLERSHSSGFGIIHWMTRPLDIYFKSMAAQAWRETENQPLSTTAGEMAARTFGQPARGAGGEYLQQWATEAPRFARETTDRFIDTPLRVPSATIAGCRTRLNVLAKIHPELLPEAGRERLNYYRDLERFIIGFYQSQQAWEEAQKLREAGALGKARQALAGSRPESLIEQYARMASAGITRGEQGLIVSLNLRWLPYIVSERQAEGVEPVRIKFQPTSHEPLAMGSGTNTFYFDRDRRVWKSLGKEETGARTFVENARARSDAICDNGLQGEINRPMSFRIGPIMGDKLVPGTYTVRLLFAPQPAFADIQLHGSAATLPVKQRLENQRSGGLPVQMSSTMEVTQGAVDVSLYPIFGNVRICAAVLEPAGAGK